MNYSIPNKAFDIILKRMKQRAKFYEFKSMESIEEGDPPTRIIHERHRFYYIGAEALEIFTTLARDIRPDGSIVCNYAHSSRDLDTFGVFDDGVQVSTIENMVTAAVPGDPFPDMFSVYPTAPGVLSSIFMAGMSDWTSPLQIYEIEGESFNQLPDFTPSWPYGVPMSISHNGAYVAIKAAADPFLGVIKRSAQGFEEVQDLPACFYGEALAWSPNDNYLAVGVTESDSPNPVWILRRSADSFEKISELALPAGFNSVNSLCYSPDGDYLALATREGSNIRLFSRTAEDYTLLPEPADPPGGDISVVSFSHLGNFLFGGGKDYFTGHKVNFYSHENGVLTKIAKPFGTPAGNVSDAEYCPSANILATAIDQAPYLQLYRHDGSGAVSMISDLPNIPQDTGYACSWSADGVYLAATFKAAPFLKVWKRDGSTYTEITTPTILEPFKQAMVFWR